MGTVNLGKVRDRVTGVERINGNGSAGTIDTYRVSFESSNYYDFNVTNGRNGVGQIVSFSGDSDSRNNLIVRIVNNQDKVLALLVKSNSESEVNDGYMQASFKVEKTAVSTEGLVTTSTYSVIAYGPTGSQLFAASCVQSNLTTVEPTVSIIISSGFKDCLDAWCLLYYNDSSTGITVDDELSDNSTNPVQNKVVTTALNTKLALPSTAPTTRKVVTIDTNGAQDNVDGTELTTLMGNIVDSHGNKRFVEGVGTIITDVEGLTIKYNKWSLSGTHLMIALAGTFKNGTQLPVNIDLVSFALPAWILNKIIPVWSVNIENKSTLTYAEDWTSQSISLALRKIDDNIVIRCTSAVNFTADRSFRIQYDLLIDSE